MISNHGDCPTLTIKRVDESYTNCMKNRLYEDFLLAVVADLDDQAVAVVQCDHCSGGSMSVAAVVEMEAGRPTCS